MFGPATLAPGATANFTGTFAVAADAGCSVTTSVTARGNDACNAQEVTSTSTKSCPVATAPKIVVTKSCPGTPATPGAQITYSGSVQNAGNVTLTDVTVKSGNNSVFGPVTLTPGQITSFTASGSVPSGVCSVTDTWDASGKDQCSGVTVTHSATTVCPVQGASQLEVTLRCPSGSLTPGGTATYSGTVANKGNVTVTNIVVVNTSAPGVPVFTAPSLAPGASVNFSFDGSVPTDICSLDTTVRADATTLAWSRFLCHRLGYLPGSEQPGDCSHQLVPGTGDA